jgi:ribosomal protein S18 acetylase RimI-like enzyme
MIIEQVNEVSDDLLEALSLLGPQLSENIKMPTLRQLDEIVQSPGTTLFVARASETNEKIIGMLTLVVFRTPAGISAHIEDVVVDSRQRGQGVGEALTRAAIALADQKGAKKIDLTSAPWREAANRLYQRMGFVRWETNFYRLLLDKKD